MDNSDADAEGLEPEEEARLLRERDAYVKDAVDEEAREHDIRWIPPGPDDEKLPE